MRLFLDYHVAYAPRHDDRYGVLALGVLAQMKQSRFGLKKLLFQKKQNGTLDECHLLEFITRLGFDLEFDSKVSK